VWSPTWVAILGVYANEWGLPRHSHDVIAKLLDHVTAGKAPGG
jgi:hypothetical protein